MAVLLRLENYLPIFPPDDLHFEHLIYRVSNWWKNSLIIIRQLKPHRFPNPNYFGENHLKILWPETQLHLKLSNPLQKHELGWPINKGGHRSIHSLAESYP